MKRMSFFLLYVLFSIAGISMIYSESELEVLLPPSGQYEPGNIFLYTGSGNGTGIMAMYSVFNKDKPPEIYYNVLNGNRWSTGIKVNFFPENHKILYSVGQLTNNLPIAVFGGDNSAYTDIFALDYLAENDKPGNPLDAYNLTLAEVWNILWNNQRLFFSLQKNGLWTEPIPVMDTYRASNAMIQTGPNNSAVLVFLKDMDNDYSTTNDIQLFYSFFNNRGWKQPRQLTFDNEIKFTVQLVNIGSRYLITWGQDRDKDTKTNNDRRLYYSIVESNGNSTGIRTVWEKEQTIITPVLGKYLGKVLLLYTGEDEISPGGNTSHPVYSLSFQDKWDSPEKTQLTARYLADAKILEIDGIPCVLHMEGNCLRMAYYDGAEWKSAGVLFNANDAGINVKEISYFPGTGNILHILLTGSMRSSVDPGDTRAYEDPDALIPHGLYYTSIPLLPDLKVENLAVSPETINKGERAAIQFEVINNGCLPSGDYLVRLSNQEEEIDVIGCPSLMPAGKREFRYTIDIKQIESLLNIVVSSQAPEMDKQNNEIEHIIKVLPDYEPVSIKREDSNNFTIEVVEHKKMAAPRVPVNIYLQQDNLIRTIESSLYNPITNDPVKILMEGDYDPGKAFKVIVSVNERRTIKEDNYGNNKTAFLFKPLPDLEILDAEMNEEGLKIKIRNLGSETSGYFKLIITDDPALLAELSDTTMTYALYSSGIQLPGLAEMEFVVSPGEMKEITGSRLYIVINPLMEIGESDYNNNTFKLYLSDMPEITGKRIHLMVKYAVRVEEKMSIAIFNRSKYPAISPLLEGFNKKREKVYKKIIPVIKASSLEKIFIDDPRREIYYLKLIYQSAGRLKERLIFPIIEMRECLLVKSAVRHREKITIHLMNISGYTVFPVLEGYNRWGKRIYEKEITVMDAGSALKIFIEDAKREIFYLKLIYRYKDIIKERKIYPVYMRKPGILDNSNGR